MNKLMNNRYRIMTLLVLAVVLSAATYGFAAANTVNASVAGEGSGDISGYAVVNVTYILDSSDPTSFLSVSFDLQAGANQVYAGLEDSAGAIDWFPCLYSGSGDVWNCALAGSSVLDAEDLHVSAAE